MNPSTITGWRRYALVEPPLVLFLFASTLVDAVTTDFMVFRNCQRIVGIGKNDCDILHTNSSSKEALELEAESQPYASYILMCKSLVDGIVPAFLSFFLGPWSDKYGRKPLMIAGYAGAALSFLLWTILCTVNINSWFYILTSLPSSLMGGFCGIILATFCYITDIRSEKDRAWHLTVLQMMISGSFFFGNLSSSPIFHKFGYATVFCVACLCCTVSTLYVIFLVPESIMRTDVQKSFSSLFDVSLVKDMFLTCTKKRDGFNRVIVWGCIFALSIHLLGMQGDNCIGFLFTSAKFGWDIGDYSRYQAISVLLTTTGTFLGAKFFITFVDENLSDMGIVIFANTSLFAGAMSKALMIKPWHLYLSTALSMFGYLTAPVLRTVLSNSVLRQDAGKVFSLTTSMEAIVPLGASPLYTLIYTNNMPSIYPAPVYLVSAAIYAIIIIIAIIIDKQISKLGQSQFTVIDEEID